MEELINQIKKLPIKKDVINRWIPNPKYGIKPNQKIVFFEPTETDFIRLNDVIKLIEEYKNDERN